MLSSKQRLLQYNPNCISGEAVWWNAEERETDVASLQAHVCIAPTSDANLKHV